MKSNIILQKTRYIINIYKSFFKIYIYYLYFKVNNLAIEYYKANIQLSYILMIYNYINNNIDIISPS